MKKTRMITALTCLMLVITGCTADSTGSAEPAPSATAETHSEPHEYNNTAYDAGFDTVYAYREYGSDDAAMEENFNMGTDMFREMNDLFDIYNEYSGLNNLMTVNEKAGIEPVKVDQRIIDILKMAKEFYDLSDGAFDITMGPVLKVWHKYREDGIALNEEGKKGPVPSREELETAAACVGWDKVEIDEENSTVYLNDPCASLDVGGIAKGYAAEQIAKAVEEKDVTYAIVNAGRNIRTVNGKTDGSPWKIGIQHPKGEGSLVVVNMEGSGSFVTSGDYERFYIGEDDQSYHHIVDSKTLFPATLYHSVSIITKNSGAADCLSTTLFTLSIEDGQKLLDAYSEMSGDTAYAVWIMDKNSSQASADTKTVEDYAIAYSPELEEDIIFK